MRTQPLVRRDAFPITIEDAPRRRNGFDPGFDGPDPRQLQQTAADRISALRSWSPPQNAR